MKRFSTALKQDCNQPHIDANMLNDKRRASCVQNCGKRLSVMSSLFVIILLGIGVGGRQRTIASRQTDTKGVLRSTKTVEAQAEISGGITTVPPSDSDRERRAARLTTMRKETVYISHFSSIQSLESPAMSSVSLVQEPSATPSVSLVPLISLVPSSEPTTTKEPSTEPSASLSPSLSPVPSSEPTISKEPSIDPSATPSIAPTFSPFPSFKPSLSPSELPSAQPSSFPSDQPTGVCHDFLSYRSPINDHITCQDHADTDCTSWRYVGLSISELADLVESCPISCNIECGLFKILSTNVTFVVSNVSGVLDFTTTPPFEAATIDYLTEYVLTNSPVAKFVLTGAELYSQNIIVSRAVGPWLRRSLQQQNLRQSKMVQLEIILKLEGFWIDRPQLEVSDFALNDLLLDGVDSSGYTEALRKSDEFYASATASSAVQVETRPPMPVEPSETKKVSSATVTVSVLAAVTVCAFFGGAILYHKAFMRRYPTINTKDMPQALETPHSIGPQPANIYSFENLSPENSLGLGRILSVFSSRSSHSTSPNSSQKDSTEPNPETNEVIEDEHPLSGIIPPMIIIDNIDEDDTSPSKNVSPATPQSKAIVPTKRLEASAAFMKALHSSHNSQAGTPSALADAMYNMSSYGDEILSPSYKALPVIFSDDNVADDSSASSTQVKGTQLDVEVPLRRALSSGKVDKEVGDTELIGEFIKSQWDDKEEGSSDDGDHSEDGQLKEAMTYDQLAQKPPRAGGHQRSNSSHERHRRHSSWPEKYLVEAKHLKRGKSLSRMDSRKDPGELKSSEGSPSHKRNRLKTSSEETASSDEGTSFEGACLYSFEASHRGSLGISIEASRRGTIIHAVKEYSPLFGRVEVGDEIVNVDGVNTTCMSTVVVAHLLGQKRGRCTKMRITVSRGMVGTLGIRTISMPKRFRRKSSGHIPLSPTEEHYGLSSIDGLDSGFVELHTSTQENEAEDRDDNPFPFHFIGAGAHDDEEDNA